MITEDFLRVIPAFKLAEMLQSLPCGAWVEANAVGNLSIYSPALEYIGFVDINREKTELTDQS